MTPDIADVKIMAKSTFQIEKYTLEKYTIQLAENMSDVIKERV